MVNCVINDQNSHAGQHSQDAGREDQAQSIEKTDVGIIAQQSHRNTRSGGQAGIAPEVLELIRTLIVVKTALSIVEMIAPFRRPTRAITTVPRNTAARKEETSIGAASVPPTEKTGIQNIVPDQMSPCKPQPMRFFHWNRPDRVVARDLPGVS